LLKKNELYFCTAKTNIAIIPKKKLVKDIFQKTADLEFMGDGGTVGNTK
jgi:hypothetical protein